MAAHLYAPSVAPVLSRLDGACEEDALACPDAHEDAHSMRPNALRNISGLVMAREQPKSMSRSAWPQLALWGQGLTKATLSDREKNVRVPPSSACLMAA